MKYLIFLAILISGCAAPRIQIYNCEKLQGDVYMCDELPRMRHFERF